MAARLELTHHVLVEPTRRSRDVRNGPRSGRGTPAAARAAEEECAQGGRRGTERERQELLLQVERAKAERAASEMRYQTEKRRRAAVLLSPLSRPSLLFAGFWGIAPTRKDAGPSAHCNANARSGIVEV